MAGSVFVQCVVREQDVRIHERDFLAMGFGAAMSSRR
jgi:hypothetical protein